MGAALLLSAGAMSAVLLPRPIAIALLLAAAPALGVPGGEIDSLPRGTFICEMPGDATGAAGLRQDGEHFTIISASTYEAGGKRGSYLLTGDRLVMTSGPKKGEKFHRISNSFLRKTDADGRDGQMRCVRRVVNNT